MDELVAVVNDVRDAFSEVKVDLNLNLPHAPCTLGLPGAD